MRILEARIQPAEIAFEQVSRAHLFRAIIFDWDGTAVVDRQESAEALALLMETLLRMRVWLVIATGTNVTHIDRQIIALLSPFARRHLYICTNRGSEVYGFDRFGAQVRRQARIATAEEERKLTAIAEALRDDLAAHAHVTTQIVYDRMNRRKVDLIPVPEWANPPKTRIDELLAAVEHRLHDAGVVGGLLQIIRRTEELAKQVGLPEARITSDVKHIEIGLTDKVDSVRWITRHLLSPRHIPDTDVLIAGDEFGNVGGLPGSDDRLRQLSPAAPVISVGIEPEGVPDGVLHIGGGPARFRAFLAEQIQLRRQQTNAGTKVSPVQRLLGNLFAPPYDPAWTMVEGGQAHDDAALEHDVESRFTISNGALGVRGSLEQPTLASSPLTLVAGLFAPHQRAGDVPSLTSAPDWSHFELSIDGHTLALDPLRTAARARRLVLRDGLLLNEWVSRGPSGYTVRVRTCRFTSLANRALMGQVAGIEIDAPVYVQLRALEEPAGTKLRLEDSGARGTLWTTNDRTHQLAVATHATLHHGSGLVAPTVAHDGTVSWQWVATPNQPATFVRLTTMVRGEGQHWLSDLTHTLLRRASQSGVRRLLAAHTSAWAGRWAAADVVIEGDDDAQHALRFALYHLIGAANPDDERVSIGARALTGEGYLGHVFWDTEIFLVPFYTFTWPAAARALLMYRYHTLPAARRKAAARGFTGALYAWESTDTGEEATPEHAIAPDGTVVAVLNGTQEQHISADVAYAVWHYWDATHDVAFLLNAGAEIILECARFYASRVTLDSDGRYHLCGVIGPDEYHQDVDDNAYTNVMARWNLQCARTVVLLLERRWPERWQTLRDLIALTPEEVSHWEDVAQRLITGEDMQSGLYEQFAGFFHLEQIDLTPYVSRTMPLDIVLGAARVQQAQVIKQADVVMLLALHWDAFTANGRRANFDYYEARCSHGSSLSPSVHALVAARLGEMERAYRYFQESAAIDLSGSAGDVALGVHIAALGGIWQIAVFGFAGLSVEPDGLRFTPHLPDAWTALRFPLQWRGRMLRVAITKHAGTVTLTLELSTGTTLDVHIGARRQRLQAHIPQSWVQHAPGDEWMEAL